MRLHPIDNSIRQGPRRGRAKPSGRVCSQESRSEPGPCCADGHRLSRPRVCQKDR
jgi:hypothetical protein